MERKRTVRTTVIKTQTLVGTELRPNSKRKAAANRVVLNNESTIIANKYRCVVLIVEVDRSWSVVTKCVSDTGKKCYPLVRK